MSKVSKASKACKACKASKACKPSKRIHVVPRGKEWAVERENAKRASSKHSTQRDAIAAAKKMAAREKGEVIVHRPDGSLRAE